MSKILTSLKDEFKDFEFRHEEISFGGQIHSFYVKIDTAGLLDLYWDKIRNFIAVYFQSKLEQEYSKWNLYLFFLTPDQITRELKHKIEHDTLSSRKIVIEKYESKMTIQFCRELFDEHVGNEGIDLNKPVKSIPDFKKDKILSGVVHKLSVHNIKNRKDSSFLAAHEQLEKKLKR